VRMRGITAYYKERNCDGDRSVLCGVSTCVARRAIHNYGLVLLYPGFKRGGSGAYIEYIRIFSNKNVPRLVSVRIMR